MFRMGIVRAWNTDLKEDIDDFSSEDQITDLEEDIDDVSSVDQ